MPNEQTSVPLFTSGEVLTAANMNISAGTGVPVFATTVTRDAAFGGTSEKVLAEGQLCYLSSTNVVQYYDGAAWATVGPSSGSGLNLISTTTIGTTVASVTVSSVFSSTYDNYQIVFAGTTISATARARIAINGSTGSTYEFAAIRYDIAGGSSAVETGLAGTTWYVGLGNAGILSGGFTLYSPNKVSTTQITGQSYCNNYAWNVGGSDTNSASSTGFTMSLTAGTYTGGTIKVYGMAN
jgi:hypothetical protein